MAAKSKSKVSVLSKAKIPLIALGTLVILVLLTFALRGWLRVTVIPKTIGLLYMPGISSTFEKQDNTLGHPLQSLGFQNVATKKHCLKMIAQGYHVDIDCIAIQQGYVVLPSSAEGIAKEQQAAAKIQSALQASGWQGGSNGVTVTSLIDGTTQGKDYSPDAYYEKTVGKNHCIFDIFIAYSNPKPPAISIQFFCERTFYFLGKTPVPIYPTP